MHRPDIPLPNSSGQGFKEQNRVFENLSRQDQQAVNNYVVCRVEAEQAEKRRMGTAEYRVVDAMTGKGSADGAPKNISGSVMQGSTNGMLLGRRIAPNRLGHGGAQVSASGSHSMNPSVVQSHSYNSSSQAPMQHGLASNYHAIGDFPGNQHGGPISSQTWSPMSFVYGGQGMIYANPAMAYNQHADAISQHSDPTGMLYSGPPTFDYPNFLPGPQPAYPNSVYAHQYAGGPPLTNPPRLEMQSPLESASSSSVQSSPATNASSFTIVSSICSRIQCEGGNYDEDVDEEGQSSGERAAKRARRT